MKYTDGSKFTQDEKDAMDGLARVVAFVFDIEHDEIMSSSRKRIFADARKVACKYAFDNIKNSLIQNEKNLALASWYFGLDHGSVHHAVQAATSLYHSDKAFTRLYDAVVNIIDNPSYTPDFTYADLYLSLRTWEDVRLSIHEPLSIRYSLMPEEIVNMALELYGKGYCELTIANKCGTSVELINYLIKKRELTRENQLSKVLKSANSRFVKMGISQKIEY